MEGVFERADGWQREVVGKAACFLCLLDLSLAEFSFVIFYRVEGRGVLVDEDWARRGARGMGSAMEGSVARGGLAIGQRRCGPRKR